jgi:hypothetical protein
MFLKLTLTIIGFQRIIEETKYIFEKEKNTIEFKLLN